MFRNVLNGSQFPERESWGTMYSHPVPTPGQTPRLIDVIITPRASPGPMIPGVRRTPGHLCGGDTQGRNDPPPVPGPPYYHRTSHINRAKRRCSCQVPRTCTGTGKKVQGGRRPPCSGCVVVSPASVALAWRPLHARRAVLHDLDAGGHLPPRPAATCRQPIKAAWRPVEGVAPPLPPKPVLRWA